VIACQPEAPGLPRSRDFLVLLAALLLVVGVLVFLVLATLIRSDNAPSLDEQIIHSMRNPDPAQPKKPIGPFWLRRAGPDISALGGASVLTLITILVAGYLLLWRKYGATVLLLVATVGGVALETSLKHIIHRERPDERYRVLEATTNSFPSGHSMLSAVVYLTLGALLARFVSRRAEKIYVVFVAMLLTFLVGASRVYLRVHYPTDVLAGWSVGLAWAMLCWLVARYLQRRHVVEPPVGE
jgi:undecaprenyl-diphosphatase